MTCAGALAVSNRELDLGVQKQRCTIGAVLLANHLSEPRICSHDLLLKERVAVSEVSCTYAIGETVLGAVPGTIRKLAQEEQ